MDDQSLRNSCVTARRRPKQGAIAECHCTAIPSVAPSGVFREVEEDQIRKVWVSIKLFSAKFGSPPPPKRAQNEEKPYKSVENPQIDTFFRGGGVERNFMDKTILWTSGRF